MKKALFIPVSGELQVWEFNETQEYEVLKKAVGGWIEGVDLPHQRARLWLNEEGKLDGLKVNENATTLWVSNYGFTDLIVGDTIVTGLTDDEGNSLGLTDEQINEIYLSF